MKLLAGKNAVNTCSTSVEGLEGMIMTQTGKCFPHLSER